MAPPRLAVFISPLHVLTPEDSTLYASMPLSPSHNPRKRQRAEPVQLEKATQPTAKRQRIDCNSKLRALAAYWDNASKVWLTRRALKELDRRTLAVSPAQRPVRQRAHQPVTRSCAGKTRGVRSSAGYTVDPLSACSARTARRIKLTARQGGPDLSELRNVRVAAYWLMVGLD